MCKIKTENEPSPAGLLPSLYKVVGMLGELLLTVLYVIVVLAILVVVTKFSISIIFLAPFGVYGNFASEILPSLLLFVGGEVYYKRIGQLRFITRITCVIFWTFLATYYTLFNMHYFESM